VVELSRRAALALLGIGAVGTALSWPRLTGSDIPGRRDDALTVALFGTQQDAIARQALVEGFQRIHPDIKVRIVAIQGQDWSNFFAKILTMVSAGRRLRRDGGHAALRGAARVPDRRVRHARCR
jgi:multiple sugar transport system substrate-binding protein